MASRWRWPGAVRGHRHCPHIHFFLIELVRAKPGSGAGGSAALSLHILRGLHRCEASPICYERMRRGKRISVLAACIKNKCARRAGANEVVGMAGAFVWGASNTMPNFKGRGSATQRTLFSGLRGQPASGRRGRRSYGWPGRRARGSTAAGAASLLAAGAVRQRWQLWLVWSIVFPLAEPAELLPCPYTTLDDWVNPGIYTHFRDE